MRAFTAMIATSIKVFLRDRSSVFWGVAFPLILMGLIGLAFGRSSSVLFTVSVVDEGNPQMVQPLLVGLRQVPVFKVIEEDRKQALGQLQEGERTLVIVIPAQGTTLEAIYDSSREQNGRTALVILERFVAEANLRIARASAVLTVKTSSVAGEDVRFFDFLLPGILAMTIAQTGLLGVSTVVATMRERLLLKRVMATPVPPLAFLGGLVGRFSLVNLLQSALILLVATLVFGARIRGSLLDLAALALVGAVGLLRHGLCDLHRLPDAGIGEPPRQRRELPDDVPVGDILAQGIHA